MVALLLSLQNRMKNVKLGVNVMILQDKVPMSVYSQARLVPVAGAGAGAGAGAVPVAVLKQKCIRINTQYIYIYIYI